ncbi:hypothetical protein K1719_009642 [Acacia pycnantha]|nr:hypothetical protein K1719_009642 [Acacia pycnantha]
MPVLVRYHPRPSSFFPGCLRRTSNMMFGAVTILVHEGVVEDVAWNLRHEYLIGSVGDDQYLLIRDLWIPSISKPVQSVVAHQSESEYTRLLLEFALLQNALNCYEEFLLMILKG